MSFRFSEMGMLVVQNPKTAHARLEKSMQRHENNMGLVAAEFGVCHQTVQHWFGKLEAAGMPVAGRGAAKPGRKPKPKKKTPSRARKRSRAAAAPEATAG